MKRATITFLTASIIAIAFVFLIGIAYYLGKPVYDGIRQDGWMAVFAAIFSGSIVGLLIFVCFYLPKWLLNRIWKRVQG